MTSSICHQTAKLRAQDRSLLFWEVWHRHGQNFEGSALGTGNPSVGSTHSCHLCSHTYPPHAHCRSIGWLKRGHVRPPLGRPPVYLTMEGLLCGGYSLLGTNLDTKMCLYHHRRSFCVPLISLLCLQSSKSALLLSLIKQFTIAYQS